MVEHNLAKVGVASSSLVFRSTDKEIAVKAVSFCLCPVLPVAARCHSVICLSDSPLSFRAPSRCPSARSIVILSGQRRICSEDRPKLHPLIWIPCAEASVRQRLCAQMMPYRAYIEGSVRRDAPRSTSLRIKQQLSTRVSVHRLSPFAYAN